MPRTKEKRRSRSGEQNFTPEFSLFDINALQTVVDNVRFWSFSATETDCTAPPVVTACQTWIQNEGESGFEYDPDLADICPDSEIYCVASGWPCDRDDPGFMAGLRTCYHPPYWIQNRGQGQGQGLKRARSVSFISLNPLFF